MKANNIWTHRVKFYLDAPLSHPYYFFRVVSYHNERTIKTKAENNVTKHEDDKEILKKLSEKRKGFKKV